MIFSSSAPGSLMLFGEHAVLHGKQALCCAVDQRIRATLTPRSDQRIYLSSPLGVCEMELAALTVRAPFEFVLTAIDRYRLHFHQGFELAIQAEFSATMGLGSSSAVTVAVVGVLNQYLGRKLTPRQLFDEAKAVVLQVQGMGSGADVAAAVFGGLVAYRLDPLEIQSFPIALDLALVYSGAKVPTRTVIQIVAEKQQVQPERYEQLYTEIDRCAEQAVAILQARSLAVQARSVSLRAQAKQSSTELPSKYELDCFACARDDHRNTLTVKCQQNLGELMNQHHALQAALGVSTPLLDELAADLREQAGIYGAKISGSGLGDCVVGLGVAAENLFPRSEAQRQAGVKPIPVAMSTVGYRQHE